VPFFLVQRHKTTLSSQTKIQNDNDERFELMKTAQLVGWPAKQGGSQVSGLAKYREEFYGAV
jgi:hypothetical protein